MFIIIEYCSFCFENSNEYIWSKWYLNVPFCFETFEYFGVWALNGHNFRSKDPFLTKPKPLES